MESEKNLFENLNLTKVSSETVHSGARLSQSSVVEIDFKPLESLKKSKDCSRPTCIFYWAGYSSGDVKLFGVAC